MEMAPSPEGTGGLWVAKKVPDGEVFVAANEFRIRDIDPDDPDMLYARDLHAIAEKNGWWNPDDGQLDWLATVSQGEYNHPYYSLRRVWRLQSRLAPSQEKSPWVENGLTRAYPFSIKPDHKLNVRDVMSLYRDHYQGTQFDLSKGVTAGPFGCPYRYPGPKDPKGDTGDPSIKREGAWERPISITLQEKWPRRQAIPINGMKNQNGRRDRPATQDLKVKKMSIDIHKPISDKETVKTKL